jgi:hypothetical protein
VEVGRTNSNVFRYSYADTGDKDLVFYKVYSYNSRGKSESKIYLISKKVLCSDGGITC